MIKCLKCGKELKMITTQHLKKCSGITIKEYKKEFLNAETITKETKNKLSRVMKDKTLSEDHKQKIKDNHARYWKNKSRSIETKEKISKTLGGVIPWNKGGTVSEETRKKISKTLKINHPAKGKHLSADHKKKLSKSHIFTLEQYQKLYPLFCRVEEMRYNPDKPGEIQIHCKNHLCSNSKEMGGWFTTNLDLFRRRRDALEHDDGNDGAYFYCSEKCKQECPLFNMRSDPNKDNEELYTSEEYETFRQEVLRRQRKEFGFNFCERCENKSDLVVHHEKPKKTHPHMILDPDNGIILCKECHFKKVHKDECSTGKLASLICNPNDGK